MATPHPHAALIKQWADDTSIEFETKDHLGNWIDAEPSWGEDYEYRIKPEVLRYRVALYKYHEETRVLVRKTDVDKDLPSTFIEWKTDWIEVEI